MAETMFDRLPKEKRLRIIEGAMQEFADYGFEGASTNRIVKTVGISKGSLFNYFASKDELWLYLAEYVLNIIIPRLREKIRHMPDDVFERMKIMTIINLEFYIENPLYYSFFMSILEQGGRHLQQQLMERVHHLMDVLDFFKGVDTSRFRYDEESTFTLIGWLYAGIKQELFAYQHVRKDAEALQDELLQRIDKVIEVLKGGIYKRPD